jgi:hypothetical protein
MTKSTSTPVQSRPTLAWARAQGMEFVAQPRKELFDRAIAEWLDTQFPCQLPSETQEQYDALLDSMEKAYWTGIQMALSPKVEAPAGLAAASNDLNAAHETLLQVNELFRLIRECVQQGDKCPTSIFSLAKIGIKITSHQAEAIEEALDRSAPNVAMALGDGRAV